MRTRTARTLTVLTAALLIAVNTAAAAEPRRVPMTADGWETVFGTMDFKEQNGAQALVMTAEGAAAVKGLSFKSGTLEFDVDPVAMGAGLAPDGRLSVQNGSFVLPLKAGDNEIAVALANNFYGWGLILRLENLDGLTLARK